jgi:hypothetical protein
LPFSADVFDSKNPVPVELRDNNLVISLPDDCPNSYYATIDLHFLHQPVQIAKSLLRNNQVRLTPFQAKTSESLTKEFVPYAFKFWYNKNCVIEYNVYLDAGEYTLQAEYAAWFDGGEIYFDMDGRKYTGYYQTTGTASIANDLNNFIIADLNVQITLPESKVYTIKITRNAEISNVTNWINVRNFTLKADTIYTDDGKKKTQIYPNPVKDGYFICESPNSQSFKIMDILGCCHKTFVSNPGKQTVDVSSIQPGIYIVCGKTFSQQIIIQ